MPRRCLPRHWKTYEDAVLRAGGVAHLIPAGQDLGGTIDMIDGILIPGGRDLPPILYGETPRFAIQYECPERICFELLLLRDIIVMKKPVLGICYGMQLMNVCLGGSLYQDIKGELPKAHKHEEEEHLVEIEVNPYIGSGCRTVNSSHHQAVKNMAAGLDCIGRARDGIVEAFFLRDYGFFVGVQWHPERMRSALSEELFVAFIGACRAGQ